MKTMATRILRRNSEAYFRDLSGDWIACKVMHVTGSGHPTNEIKVKFVTSAWSCSGFVRDGVVLERPSTEVIPKSAMRIDSYGHRKEAYKCQETYPEKNKKV